MKSTLGLTRSSHLGLHTLDLKYLPDIASESNIKGGKDTINFQNYCIALKWHNIQSFVKFFILSFDKCCFRWKKLELLVTVGEIISCLSVCRYYSFFLFIFWLSLFLHLKKGCTFLPVYYLSICRTHKRIHTLYLSLVLFLFYFFLLSFFSFLFYISFSFFVSFYFFPPQKGLSIGTCQVTRTMTLFLGNSWRNKKQICYRTWKLDRFRHIEEKVS